MGLSGASVLFSLATRIVLAYYESEVQRGVQAHFRHAELYRNTKDDDERDYPIHTGNYVGLDELSSDDE